MAMKQRVEMTLEEYVKEGVFERVEVSNWATPIVPVVKHDNSIRLCGDFKVTVNPHIQINQYPLPTLEEQPEGLNLRNWISDRLIYSWEFGMEDREILTLNTHKGLFRPTRLIYGISCAPSIWQNTIEQILQGTPGVAVYLDDINVTGETPKIHLQRLELVLIRLQKYNIRLNMEKCSVFADQVEYCGHLIDARGIHKVPAKVEAIKQAPYPTDITTLESFHGLVNYYGRFFEHLSGTMHPLTRLLHKNIPWNFTTECRKVVDTIKSKMMEPTFLTHFDAKRKLVLVVDASPYGVSAVLSHEMDDGTESTIDIKIQRKCSYTG